LEELPYNFLIAGDCQAFEVRGWQYSSNFLRDLPGSSSLVIAFVGKFSRKAPSVCQLKTAQALILESLKRRKLQPEYQLYVVGQQYGGTAAGVKPMATLCRPPKNQVNEKQKVPSYSSRLLYAKHKQYTKKRRMSKAGATDKRIRDPQDRPWPGSGDQRSVAHWVNG